MISKLKQSPLIQGGIVLVDQGAMSLISFATGVLVARSNSADEYSIYMLGWSIVLIVKGFQEAVVNIPYTVFAPRMATDEVKVYRGSNNLISTIFLALVLAVLGILYFVYLFLESLSDIEILSYTPVLSLLIVVFLVRDYFRNTLLAHLEIGKGVVINLSANVLLIISILLIFFFSELKPSIAYLLFCFWLSVTAALMYYEMRGWFAYSLNQLRGHFRKNWELGRWSILSSLAHVASRTSLPWMVIYHEGYDVAAVYYGSMAVALAPAPLLRGVSAFLLPKMSHGFIGDDYDRLRTMLYKSIVVLAIPYSLWLIITLAFGVELVDFFFDDSIQAYGVLFALLAVGTVIDFICAPMVSALQTTKNTKAITLSLVTGASVTLSFGWLLVTEYGLIGAGTTYLMVSIVINLCILLSCLKSFR